MGTGPGRRNRLYQSDVIMTPILGETFIHQSDEFIPSYIGKPDSMQLKIPKIFNAKFPRFSIISIKKRQRPAGSSAFVV